MSYAVPDAVRAALDGRNAAVARLSALNADNSVRASWETGSGIILSGSATRDRMRAVRGHCDIQMANKTGSLSPVAIDDYFSTGQRFRAERGVIVSGTRYYVPLGTYVVNTFDSSMGGRLKITGNDPLSLVQQQFGEVVTLDGALTGEDALRQLLEPVLGSGAAWSLDAGGRTLGGRPRSYAEDDDRLASALSMAADLGCELFADRLGYPVLQPMPDPTAVATSRSYVTDATAMLLDLTRSGSYLPFNRVIVIGNPPGGPIVRGQADITDVGSPLHASRIGLRVAPFIRSAQIVTQEQANAVAQNTLIRQALQQDSINAPVVEDVTVDEGDVVAINEPITATADRYWLSSVTHQLTASSMNVAGARAIPLFAA